MTDLTKNPDLRSREKIDDYFGDWKWSGFNMGLEESIDSSAYLSSTKA